MPHRQDSERFEAVMAWAESVLVRAERLLERYEPDDSEWEPPTELEAKRRKRRNPLDDHEVAAVVTCLGCHAGLAKLGIAHAILALLGT